jgi:hypothetical protein
MSEDRKAFEAHMAELHRCLTCPIDAARLEAIDGAAEEAEQGHQEAAQAVDLWPGTDVPRNQPIWPGLGVWARSSAASHPTSAL